VESIRLREVHFFGLKESEAIVEVDIRNNGDTTTEIIGYNTGCGCSRVELESKVIPPGQQVRIRMSVRINPVNSMSERVVAVALSFKGNCSAQLQLPIVAVPSVRVSGFRGSHRTALDAGTLYVQRRIDDDCEIASVEFDVCRGFLETNEASPNESEVRIQGIAHNTLSCHFIGTANEFTERLGGHQIEWARYRIAIEVPENTLLPQHVQIELVYQDGLSTFLGLTLDRKSAFEISPATVVLKEELAMAEITICRSDGSELGEVGTVYNEQLLNVAIEHLAPNSATCRLTVNQWPKTRLVREVLSLTTEDGLTSTVRIVLISPQ